MNPFSFKIPQISDRKVVHGFLKVLENWDKPNFIANLAGAGQIASVPVDENGNFIEEWSDFIELESTVLLSLTVRLGSISFTYRRGGEGHSSAIYDDIHVNINTNLETPNQSYRLRLIADAKQEFKAFDPERTFLSTANELGAQYAALHDSTLVRLEEVATDLVSKSADQQLRLEEEYRNKRVELEKEAHESKKRQDIEFSELVQSLNQREEDLRILRASIDDRDNTHARRETRNKLLEDVKNRIENFGVTRITEKKRSPVAGTFVFIISILFLLGIATWIEIKDYHNQADLVKSAIASALPKEILRDGQTLALTKSDLYILWARLSLVVLSIIGIALYFVRWQNRWAEQHSGSEFQLQQFYLDVNRANWVVESGLEWHKETGSSIPNELLEKLTHNLFKAATEAPPAIHPADELASALIGSASKLKLKAGDSEIEFDKPGKIPEKA